MNLRYMAHQFPGSLPKGLSKTDIFRGRLARLEERLPGKKNWRDSARTERPTSQTRRHRMLGSNFQLNLDEIRRPSCGGQLCLSRPDL